MFKAPKESLRTAPLPGLHASCCLLLDVQRICLELAGNLPEDALRAFVADQNAVQALANGRVSVR